MKSNFTILLTATLSLLCLAFSVFAGGPGAPAAPGSGCADDEEIRQEIADAISALHVTVPDAENCNGSGGGVFTDTTVLPEFCGQYQVAVSVKGSVETMNAGFDYIFLNGHFVASSFESQQECGMTTVEGVVSLIVNSEDSVTLLYDTVDPLHHVGAYAKVTKVEVTRYPASSDCGVGGGSPGGGHVGNACVDVRLSLGSEEIAGSLGILSLRHEEPGPALSSRSGLSFLPHRGDVELLADDGLGAMLYWSADIHGYRLAADDSVWAGGTAFLRQIKTPQGLADLVDIAAGAYEVRFYHLADVGAKTNGLYGVSGTPFTLWRFRNPNAPVADYTQLEVTEQASGSAAGVWLFEYDSGVDGWSLTSDGGNRREIRSRQQVGNVLEHLYQIKNAQNEIVYQDVRQIMTFAWGDETVAKILGAASPLTTTYSYYDDPVNDGDNYGKLKLLSNPDGSWERYFYDAAGRVVKTVSPWLDSAPGAPESQCRVIETVRSEAFPQETTIVKVNGVEVSRSYSGTISGEGYEESYSIAAGAAGAAWDAAGNQAAITRSVKQPGSLFDGKTLFLVSPDGSGQLNTYQTFANFYRESSASGRFDSPYSSSRQVVSGTVTESDYSLAGVLLTRAVRDIESGLVLDSAVCTSDEFGRTVRTDYADGTFESTEYACCGPSLQVARDGQETSFAYDALKRLSYTEKNGITTFYGYDAAGRRTEVTVQGRDGTQYTTFTLYNDLGETVATIDRAGNTTFYSRGPVDNVMTETETRPEGSTSITCYHRDGSIATVSGSAVSPTRHVYAVENGEQTTQIIRIGTGGSEAEWEKTCLDFLGRAYKTIYPDNTFSLSEYDASGRVSRQVSPGGVITLFAYDTPFYDAVQATDMDADGVIDYAGPDLVSATKTSYVYDQDRVVRRRRGFAWPDESDVPVVTGVNDSSVDGRFQRSEDAEGRVTVTETLLLGNARKRVRVVSPEGTTTASDYLYGRLQRVIDSVAGETVYQYDGFDRVLTVSWQENGIQKQQVSEYDAAGRLTASHLIADGQTRMTRYEYDIMGRVTVTILPDGRKLLNTYDLKGNLTGVSGNQYPVSYGFDPQGRQVSMTTFRDAGTTGDTITWAFDNRGRMTRKTYPDNSHTDYTYTGDGLLASRTWSRGVVTSYTYDVAGRLLTVSYSDNTPSLAYTYTRASLPASVTDASGTRVLTYTSSGRASGETLPQLVNGTISRVNDGQGRQTSLELAVNAVPDLALAWQYDTLGHLAAVSGGGNRVVYSWRSDGRRLAGLMWRRNDADLLPVEFTYDAWENIAKIGFGLPGQVRELAYEYDAGGRRTGITLANVDRWEYQYDPYGQVVQGRKFDGEDIPYAPQQHRYLYDDIGNRKNVHSGAGARPLWYTGNALNQYVNWGSDSFIPIAGKASADAKVTVKTTASGVSRTYEPARDGEDFAIDIPVDVSRGEVTTDLEVNAVRFDEQQDVDLFRRLSGRYTVTPNAANAMTYDADGNLLAYDGWTLTWNGENRLVQIEKGSHRETYDYDYMGRRFVKKVYSKENDIWSLASEEVFVYDGYKQIAAYAGAARTLARTYAWDAAGLDTPLWTTDATGSYFYVADANKNIRALFDETGAVVAEYDYDPFGQVMATGDYAAINPYRFSSEFHDDGTGLVYYNYRYYSPKLGRWISRDPIEEEGGKSVYVMCGNNCVDSFDLLGNITLGSKITLKLAWRINKLVQFGLVGIVHNWKSYSETVVFNDDHGELIDTIGVLIFLAFREHLQKQNVTSKFKRYKIEKFNVVDMTDTGQLIHSSTGVASTGYWLSSSAKVEADGYYQARCQGNYLIYKNVRIKYNWFDNIDANSFIEAYNAGAFSSSFGSAIANIIESSWDIIGEKILSTDYSIIVKGKYNIEDGTIPLPRE